jgi:FlaG/FlaF family flagellin (archaellin)
VAFNVEGKKYRALGEDCQAVSEVVGQVLMIAIVVLAFSSVAVVIFSDVVVDPPHTPHTDLQANLQKNNGNYTLYISHMGGEGIDLKYVKITLFNSSGELAEFPDLKGKGWDSERNVLNNNVLTLGDYIEIDTGVKLASSDTINIFLVYTPSQQVIQRFTLRS